jgi:hypothetical protein
MTNILQRIKHEFLHVLPPTIFFLFAFNIVAITTILLLKERGVDVPPVLMATFLALVVGKVILIADHLPFINKFPDKPLIYNIAWKTFIYMVVVFIVRYFEHFIPAFREHGGIVEAHQQLLREFAWRRFVAIQLWLFVLFVFYSVLVELVRALGKERVVKMFFG